MVLTVNFVFFFLQFDGKRNDVDDGNKRIGGDERCGGGTNGSGKTNGANNRGGLRDVRMLRIDGGMYSGLYTDDS